MGGALWGYAMWVGCKMGGAQIQDGGTHDVDFSPILAFAFDLSALPQSSSFTDFAQQREFAES